MSQRWTTDDISDQTGKVAIVTGGNSGIGFETVRALAKKGATVILACRDEAKGLAARARILDEAPSALVEVEILDLSSLASVRAFADRFRRAHPRLDVLINNAGVMATPFKRSADGFELQFATNHLGHFALTGELLESLLAAPSSRVVNVSSIAHRIGRIRLDNLRGEKRYRKWLAYGQSKLANLLFTYELQRRLSEAGAGTKALAAHPGWSATNLQSDVGIAKAMNPIMAQNAEMGALPTLYAAVAPEAGAGDYIGPGGPFEWRGFPKKVRSNRRSHDRAVAAQLWSASEELSGVTYRFQPRAAAESPVARVA